MTKPPFQLIYLLIALLVIALLPLPYGYYELLRVVAVVGLAWTAFATWHYGLIGASVAAGVLALLYNPVLPVHLTKEIWTFINLGSAGFLFFTNRHLSELLDSVPESTD